MSRGHICKCHQLACTCPANWTLCKYCGADITWTRTENDAPMAIDGHVKAGLYDPTLHKTHWATCENPPERKRKASPSKPQTKAVNPKQGDLFADYALEQLRELRAAQQGGAGGTACSFP